MTIADKIGLSRTRVVSCMGVQLVGCIETHVCLWCTKNIFAHADDGKCLFDHTRFAPSESAYYLNFVHEENVKKYPRHPVVVDDATFRWFAGIVYDPVRVEEARRRVVQDGYP